MKTSRAKTRSAPDSTVLWAQLHLWRATSRIGVLAARSVSGGVSELRADWLQLYEGTPGLWIMNMWLTQSWLCPRRGRASRTLALCPWWTSWLQLAGSLADFHRRSLAATPRETKMSQNSVNEKNKTLTFKVIFTNTCRHMFIKTNTLWSNGGARTDGLDDGVLDDPLLALPTADGRNAGGGVPPRAVAQLKVHAHPQVFEQSVEHLQHGGPCHHTREQVKWTAQETLAWHFRKQEETGFDFLFVSGLLTMIL